MKKLLYFGCILLLMQVVAAQTCNNAISADPKGSRFTLNGDEVTDTATELVWQRCSLGQTGSDCSGGSAVTYTWRQALQVAEAERSKTGVSWRLPNFKELLSITDGKCHNPAIDLAFFPSTLSSFYWTASPSAYPETGVDGWSFSIEFSGGGSFHFSRSRDLYVRLVRDK